MSSSFQTQQTLRPSETSFDPMGSRYPILVGGYTDHIQQTEYLLTTRWGVVGIDQYEKHPGPKIG